MAHGDAVLTCTEHCWVKPDETGLVLRLFLQLPLLPSLLEPNDSPKVLPPPLRAVVGGLFLATKSQG